MIDVMNIQFERNFVLEIESSCSVWYGISKSKYQQNIKVQDFLENTQILIEQDCKTKRGDEKYTTSPTYILHKIFKRLDGLTDKQIQVAYRMCWNT